MGRLRAKYTQVSATVGGVVFSGDLPKSYPSILMVTKLVQGRSVTVVFARQKNGRYKTFFYRT
jgi:hypothetical protein